jgi:alpha-tubulin suppressor-like RCC1 family protein
VTTGDAVMCWGSNLGNGTTNQSSVPVGVTGLGSGAVAVSVSREHSCALTSAGAAKCWGINGHGELGNGTITDSTVPVGVTGLGSGVAGVSAGYLDSCALT